MSRPYFCTPQTKPKQRVGLGLEAPSKRVEEEFGEAEKIDEGGARHWYWKKGIEFRYDDVFKVESIFVFVPIGAAPSGVDDTLQPEQALETRVTLRRHYSRNGY